MNRISAQIIADSISPQGDRITTYILKFPRIILAEAKTHRIISGLHGDIEILEDISLNGFREGSKNSASSRAIPFEKIVKMVEEEPFIPIAWQKDHKGMQGSKYFTDIDKASVVDGHYPDSLRELQRNWLKARDEAIKQAKKLNSLGLTKQLCNRLLEPYMYHTVLVTATEWSNFFDLRCPKYIDPSGKSFKSKKDYRNNSKWSCCEDNEDDIIGWLECNNSQAEIHIQDLAEKMWDAYNASKPKELKEDEWHIPFGDKMDSDQIYKATYYREGINKLSINRTKIKIATARCARLSYMTFDGDIDYEKDIRLHDQLLENHHYSCFEHCARVMTEKEYESFYKGKLHPRTITTSGTGRLSADEDWEVFETGDGIGWCNNFKGFISYRYLIENKL
jgi:hypothetical protein